MAPAASCGSAGAWEPSLPARGELASNAVLRSSLSGAILLHRQVTQLRGDSGDRNSHRCACGGCAHCVGGWRLSKRFQKASASSASRRPPVAGPPAATTAIVSRPQSACAPLVACPPQDGVSLAMNPSGVDGVGL